MKKYVLGVDQGGTKTLVAISDLEGNVLGVAESFGSCHSIDGMENAMEAVLIAVNELKEKVSFTNDNITRVACGMTGADFDFEYLLLKENVSKTLNIDLEKVIIVNDCMIALRSGTNNKDGVVICAGTGLNCGFINKKNEKLILGYYILDEYQGGSAIGERAIFSVFDEEVGIGKQTKLTDKILDFYGVENVDRLLQEYRLNEDIRWKQRKLLPIVTETAMEGDEVAKKIVDKFGTKWAEYIIAGCKKLLIDYPFELVCTGGVFKEKTGLLLEKIKKELMKNGIEFTMIEPKYEPVIGAIKMALDIDEVEDCNVVNENIDNSSKKNNLIRK